MRSPKAVANEFRSTLMDNIISIAPSVCQTPMTCAWSRYTHCFNASFMQSLAELNLRSTLLWKVFVTKICLRLQTWTIRVSFAEQTIGEALVALGRTKYSTLIGEGLQFRWDIGKTLSLIRSKAMSDRMLAFPGQNLSDEYSLPPPYRIRSVRETLRSLVHREKSGR